MLACPLPRVIWPDAGVTKGAEPFIVADQSLDLGACAGQDRLLWLRRSREPAFGGPAYALQQIRDRPSGFPLELKRRLREPLNTRVEGLGRTKVHNCAASAAFS
jgi:hypothetical protein